MASRKRDEFSKLVKATLRDRVGSVCSQPACGKATVGPDVSSEDRAAVIGVAAHICAAASGGPRYDAKQTPIERASILNAIWLCANCAALIDKNAGRGYSVRQLNKWKNDAEAQAHDALLSSAAYRRPPWLERLSTVHYANVPRLAQMLSVEGIPDSVIETLQNGFPTSGMIVQELVALEKAIEAANVEALPLDDILPPSEDIVGSVISFHHNCMTKNGVIDREEVSPKWISDFNQERSPHFYIKIRGTRLNFPYDPRWVTTTTAYSDFRAGRIKFAGLGVVKRISGDLTEVIVSPLLVGLPRHPAWDGLL